jgi:hypothetical protein
MPGERVLERGHVKLALQRELAEGNLSPAKLAQKYGVSREGVRDFAKRYAAVIEEIRADLTNEFAGLWVADKKRRVAAYQQDIDLVDAETERVLAARDEHREMLSSGGDGGGGFDEDGEIEAEVGVATDLGRLSRIKHRALRAVAEELGQLPTRALLRIEDDGAGHSYVGVDIDKV